jgi:hypothetical protein
MCKKFYNKLKKIFKFKKVEKSLNFDNCLTYKDKHLIRKFCCREGYKECQIMCSTSEAKLFIFGDDYFQYTIARGVLLRNLNSGGYFFTNINDFITSITNKTL